MKVNHSRVPNIVNKDTIIFQFVAKFLQIYEMLIFLGLG